MNPLVSIIFPCYNAELFIRYSLDSIIQQDYKRLEIICINDGSSDRTLEMLNDYKARDSRIVVINNEKNLGLIVSLNNALKYVTGEYFARMDADDYSPPERISKQLNFLLDNRHLDLISSGSYSFKTDNQKNYYLPPVAKSTKALIFLSLFSNPFVHGSIFGKTSIIKSGQFIYNHDYPHAEDFELFSNLAWNNCSIGSINEPLYWLRINLESVSFKYSDIQTTTNLKIVKRNLCEFLNVSSDIDEHILKILFNRIDVVVSIKDIEQAFLLFSNYFNLADEKLAFNKTEKTEIENYLLLHKLNIIIQSNKVRFSVLRYRNIGFFIKSMLLINYKQVPIFLKKISRCF
jgi:glycosyltransferase involved in cell wall biosynthesis